MRLGKGDRGGGGRRGLDVYDLDFVTVGRPLAKGRALAVCLQRLLEIGAGVGHQLRANFDPCRSVGRGLLDEEEAEAQDAALKGGLEAQAIEVGLEVVAVSPDRLEDASRGRVLSGLEVVEIAIGSNAVDGALQLHSAVIGGEHELGHLELDAHTLEGVLGG